jgi:hypothetical protein
MRRQCNQDDDDENDGDFGIESEEEEDGACGGRSAFLSELTQGGAKSSSSLSMKRNGASAITGFPRLEHLSAAAVRHDLPPLYCCNILRMCSAPASTWETRVRRSSRCRVISTALLS